MNFYCTQHQHKAEAFVKALSERHILVDDLEKAHFFLIDFTIQGLWGGNRQTPRKVTSHAMLMNRPLFLYPHSARPNVPFDLKDEFCDGVKTAFTFSEGHKKVMEIIGCPWDIEVVGWSYTDILKFKPVNKKRKIKVLFAPIHPLGDTPLPQDERDMNSFVYKLLLDLVVSREIDLKVRYLYNIETNGLFFDKNCEFIQGLPDGNMQDALNSDVIIAAYTYAYNCVALGKPLVMMGESLRPHNTPRGQGKLIYGKKWELYRDFMRFPYNVDNCRNSRELLEIIKNSGEEEPVGWKKTFIGSKFNSNKFLEKLESCL